MPMELKPWRRKVVIGDEVLEKLPKEVTQALRDSTLSDKEKLRALLQHLYKALRNHKAIAALIGVPAITVYNWMIRLNIDVKEHKGFKERRLTKVKDVTPEEAAKMWVLTHSDGNVTVSGRQVLAQIGTPDPWLIHYFKEVFGKHAEVKVKPHISSNGRPEWHAWCFLPIEGYSWILSSEPPAALGENFWEGWRR